LLSEYLYVRQLSGKLELPCTHTPSSAGAMILDDAGQFVRIFGIGRITGALQSTCKTFGIACVRHHFFVTRITAEQAGVIAEGIRIGIVGTEFFDASLRYTVYVFGSHGINGAPFPVRRGLDTEQVVTIAAVSGTYHVLAPTAFQRGLPQHETGRNAGSAFRGFGMGLQLVLERLHMSWFGRCCIERCGCFLRRAGCGL